VSDPMGLTEMLMPPNRIVKFAGAHDVMGARLVQNAGFDGVWASSLEIATSLGFPDSDVLTWQQLHAAGTAMAEAVPVPVVADCETGFGGPDAVRRLVAAYEASRVAALCLEDGASPRRNSLLPGSHHLAPLAEFTQKIETAVAHRQRLRVLARVQALVAGCGQAEALQRARAYATAGADAIVIHSRSALPDEVLAFAAAWDQPTPLVLIPTTYHTLTETQMYATGKIRMTIYANHGMRAAIASMKRVFRQILTEGTSHQAETWIAGLDEVFALQAMPAQGTSP
jgi:phosphoenolpyruvate phosphomutase